MTNQAVAKRHGRFKVKELEQKKTKDPRAGKRSKGPSVIASTTRLLSSSGVGGSGDGEAAQNRPFE